MTGSDNANRGRLPDSGFSMAGVGHTSTRRCDARKGAYLCGAPAKNAGSRAFCKECSEARAVRAAVVNQSLTTEQVEAA